MRALSFYLFILLSVKGNRTQRRRICIGGRRRHPAGVAAAYSLGLPWMAKLAAEETLFFNVDIHPSSSTASPAAGTAAAMTGSRFVAVAVVVSVVVVEVLLLAAAAVSAVLDVDTALLSLFWISKVSARIKPTPSSAVDCGAQLRCTVSPNLFSTTTTTHDDDDDDDDASSSGGGANLYITGSHCIRDGRVDDEDSWLRRRRPSASSASSALMFPENWSSVAEAAAATGVMPVLVVVWLLNGRRRWRTTGAEPNHRSDLWLGIVVVVVVVVVVVCPIVAAAAAAVTTVGLLLPRTVILTTLLEDLRTEEERFFIIVAPPPPTREAEAEAEDIIAAAVDDAAITTRVTVGAGARGSAMCNIRGASERWLAAAWRARGVCRVTFRDLSRRRERKSKKGVRGETQKKSVIHLMTTRTERSGETFGCHTCFSGCLLFFFSTLLPKTPNERKGPRGPRPVHEPRWGKQRFILGGTCVLFGSFVVFIFDAFTQKPTATTCSAALHMQPKERLHRADPKRFR